MEYLKKLVELHKTSGEMLETIISIKQEIEQTEESQRQFKATFNKTSPQFANEILIGHRKIKMLSRSYSKILKQINH